MNETIKPDEFKICKDCDGAGVIGDRYCWEWCFNCGRKGYHGPKTPENDAKRDGYRTAQYEAYRTSLTQGQVIRELESNKYPDGLPGEERR